MTGTVSSPPTVAAQTTSSPVSGFSFNGTAVGPAQTGTYTLTDSNATNSPATGSVSVNVYGHASGSVSGGTLTVPDVIVGYSAAQTSNSVNVSNASGFLANLKTTNNGPLNSITLGNVSTVGTGSSAVEGHAGHGQEAGRVQPALHANLCRRFDAQRGLGQRRHRNNHRPGQRL